MEKCALIHVENVQHVIEFADYLASEGWKILSANKTEQLLKKQHIPVSTEPALVEKNSFLNDKLLLIRRILLTRNETLYPSDSDLRFLTGAENTNNIHIICLNVYPQFWFNKDVFQLKDIAKPLNIDIPNIIRHAYTNYENLLILTDPSDYKEAMIQLKTESVTEEFRLYLAAKAINHITAYDSGIASSVLQYSGAYQEFLNYLTYPYVKVSELKSGANPQQKAFIYRIPGSSGAINGIAKLSGKDLTYELVNDVSTAWEQISNLYLNLKNQLSVPSKNCDGYDFTSQLTPLTGTVFTIIIKNNSVVGAALSTNVLDSFKNAYVYDYDSITNTVLGCSAVINEAAATEYLKHNFLAIIAPGYTNGAKEILQQNKNLRIISSSDVARSGFEGHIINGGLLVQNTESRLFDHWRIVTRNRPSQAQADQMAIAMLLAMGAKSYSAVAVKNNAVVAISQNSMSVTKSMHVILYECRQSSLRRQDPEGESHLADVMVCDTRITMCEDLKTLIDCGIKAIMQTGGSEDDEEFINYCNERGVVMVFTDMTHLAY